MEITKAMRIAVTGASGYLGRNFTSMYRDECEFVALTRGLAPEDRMDGIEYRTTDYSAESLREAFNGCDAVVHLAYAMATKENEQGGIESYRSSMEVTRNVFEAAMGLGIKNVVFASSRLVYPSYKEEPFVETDKLEPVNHYGKSKVMMEELCEEFNQKGACIKALRFGQIIGANMKVKGMFHIFMDKASKGEPLTLIGSDIRDYICVKDACRAIKAAIDHPEASGAFNISMGVGTDNRAMAEGIIRATYSASEIIISDAPVKKQPDKIVLDCSKAKDKLGFKCQYDTIEKVVNNLL